MARVLRTGARKPLVEDGTPYRGNVARWAPPKNGFVRAVGHDYTLTVTGKHPEKSEYVMHLDEDEMLATVSDWLKLMTGRRAQQARDERLAAAKSRGEHDQRDSPLKSRS